MVWLAKKNSLPVYIGRIEQSDKQRRIVNY
jgi:hypothetical protein